MTEYKIESLDKIILDESLITGFTWENKWKDLRIEIDWCGQEDLKEHFDFNAIKTHLLCEFVTEAEFNYKFKEGTMGALEITSLNLTLKDKVWFVEFRFDFYPVGKVCFFCNEMRFIIEDI